MELRRIFPGGEPVSPEEAMAELAFGDQAGEARPHLVVNFVSSLDGRATIAGKSAPLSSEADRRLFHLLRTRVDAVFAGTRTILLERYGRIARDPELRGLREAAGLSADPAAIVVTRSGNVPWDIPLFDAPEQRVLLFSPREVSPPESIAAAIEVRKVPEERALSAAMGLARTEFGVRSVLCEGGPRVFSALLDEDLVDELFLSFAPKLAGGGDALTITAGTALAEAQDTELVWALESENALFLRYAVRR